MHDKRRIATAITFAIVGCSMMSALARPLAFIREEGPYTGCLEAVCFGVYYQDPTSMTWKVKCVNRTCDPPAGCAAAPPQHGEKRCQCNGIDGYFMCKMWWSEGTGGGDWTYQCYETLECAITTQKCKAEATGTGGVEVCCKCKDP
jgi:hypothetical protein